MPPEMHITQEKSTPSGGRVDFTVEMYAAPNSQDKEKDSEEKDSVEKTV